MGLGRSITADARRLPPRRPHSQGTGELRAQRVLVFPRTQRRAAQIRRAAAVREPERFQEPRFQEWQAPNRRDAQTRYRHARRLLSVMARRQELAAGRVQPANANGVRTDPREYLRGYDRAN